MNALDQAIQSLAAATTALEHHRPTLKDVEDAKDAAKMAHEILDAAHKLLRRNIYEVAQAPSADTPLFDLAGNPAPSANLEPEENPALEENPAPEANLDRPTLSCAENLENYQDAEIIRTPEDFRNEFEEKLRALKKRGLDFGRKLKGWNIAEKSWQRVFSVDSFATICALDKLLLDKSTYDWDVPTDLLTDEEAKEC